jgi:hypothetical protein
MIAKVFSAYGVNSLRQNKYLRDHVTSAGRHGARVIGDAVYMRARTSGRKPDPVRAR